MLSSESSLLIVNYKHQQSKQVTNHHELCQNQQEVVPTVERFSICMYVSSTCT